MRPAVLTLVLAGLAVVGCVVPARAAGEDHASRQQLEMLLLRHVRLLGGVARVEEAALGKLQSGGAIDTERLGRALAAAGALDAGLTLREAILSERVGASAEAPRLRQAVRARQARVLELARRLGLPSPEAPLPDGAFSSAPAAPVTTGPPRSASQARLRLRALPVGSLEGLFDATAGIPRADLPRP